MYASQETISKLEHKMIIRLPGTNNFFTVFHQWLNLLSSVNGLISFKINQNLYIIEHVKVHTVYYTLCRPL